jgi:hypothetical protein
MSFDSEAFLTWLGEEADGGYIKQKQVAEEWPEFYENFELKGVTSKLDPETGESLTPVRDFRQAVLFGQPLD